MPNLSALGATSVLMPRARSGVGDGLRSARGASSSVTATSTQVGTERLAVTRPRPTSTRHEPGDAERDADAGVGGAAVAGEGVVPPAGADRAEGLVADELGLVDRAGVVVEAAGDLEVGHDGARHPRRARRRPRRPARRAPPSSSGCSTPSARTCSTNEASALRIRASARHCCAPSGRQPGLGLEQRRRPSRGRSCRACRWRAARRAASVAPAPRKKPSASLRLLTRITAGGHGRARKTSAMTSATSTSWWNARVSRPIDVDVGLGELAEAALLRPLAAPDLLDLVAPERELEVPGVLQHVARERHGEVEVQARGRRRPRRRSACRRRRT